MNQSCWSDISLSFLSSLWLYFKLSVSIVNKRSMSLTTDKQLERLTSINVTFYCKDDWQPCTSCLPEDRHIIGKYIAHRIERQNLPLRTCLKRLARRTIHSWRSTGIQDKIIGEFISRSHHQQFWCMTAFSYESVKDHCADFVNLPPTGNLLAVWLSKIKSIYSYGMTVLLLHLLLHCRFTIN